MSKQLKLFLISLLGTAVFTACGNNDNSTPSSPAVKNTNKNILGGKYATTNLEFPKLKGGTSKLIVYTSTAADEQKYGMNFAVEWDCEKKSNRWSCYRFDTSNRSTGKRKDDSSVVRWYPTDKLYPGTEYGDMYQPNRNYPFDYKNLTDEERLEDLYSGTGCDHGHICPSADRLYTQEANIETFYMTNMMPQYANFNQRGLWYKMEGKTRNMANSLSDADTLYIIKGGTIDKETDIIERVKGLMIIPKYFYSAYLMWKPLRGSTDRNDPANYKAMAYWFNHTKTNDSSTTLEQCMISIDELEQKTGIDFFCNLPDVVEDKVESTLSPNAW